VVKASLFSGNVEPMKKNYTTTSRYLNDAKPIGWSHATVPPVWVTPFGMTPIPRLGCGLPSEKLDVSTTQLAAILRTFPQPQAIIFPDTNFFSRKIDKSIWDAVLTRRVAITPLVWQELQPWLKNPHYNHEIRDVVLEARESFDASQRCSDHLIRNPGNAPLHQRIIFLDVSDDFTKYGYDHYLSMLKVRKLVGREIDAELRAKHGQSYTKSQFNAACQQRFGERGFRVAKDALDKIDSPTFFADEQLIVMAAQTAVLSGQETFLLTWDTGVQEQYFKLHHLLIGDWCACCAGYAADAFPETLPLRRTVVPPDRRDDPTNPVCGDEIITAMISQKDFQSEILVQDFSPVCTYCLLIGGDSNGLKVSEFAFCLEGQLTTVLEVKSLTNGQNTPSHGSRNCHVSGGPGFFGGQPFNMISLFHDRMTTVASVPISVIDAHAVLLNREQSFEHTYGSIIIP
jgi:hypothetical protein